MLDNKLPSRYRTHSFTASYLECRVNKEPIDGDLHLMCIRRVAEQLTTNTQTRADYTARLCMLGASNIGRAFPAFQKAWMPVSEDAFREHLQAAAVYLNHVAKVDSWGAPTTTSTIFGSCLELCVQSGSMDMLALYLRGERIVNRRKLLSEAAMLGRLDMVEFVHNYNIETTPWRFKDAFGSTSDSNAFKRALRTPNIVVWDYIMGLHHHYGIDYKMGLLKGLMVRYASRGWVNTARHLLEQYARGKIPMRRDGVYVPFSPAQKSYQNPVDTLLQADPNRIMTNAISNGHLNFVQLLLEYGCDTLGAVTEAAKKGYEDIVRVLLQSGADVNEEDGGLSPVCCAVLREHTSMFYFLIDHGANVPSATMREEVAKRAKTAGVESMLELLDSWSLAPGRAEV
jgi:hypothetical protein